MGGKSATVGYHYQLAWHDGLCLGPLDAYCGFVAGSKTVWSGRRIFSGTENINQPNLWGGDKDQGGIVGPLNIMFGDASATPNPYLSATFGPETVAWRGIATVAFEGGIYGANNPYRQGREHLVERIKQGWDGDACWYPAKAAIPLGGDAYAGFQDLAWILPTESGLSTVTDEFTLTGDGTSTVSVTLSLSGRIEYRPYNDNVHVLDPASPQIITANSAGVSSHSTHNIYRIEINNPAQRFYVNYKPEATWTTGAFDFSGQVLTVEIASDATVRVVADPVDGYQDGPAPQYIDIEVIGINGVAWFAKNPIHMIVWAHTQKHAGAQPLETINLDSATAAADWYYARGFGLCTARDPAQESPAEFIRRIERVAGCSFTQSPTDGLWYFDVANGEYDLASLPILGDDDILEFEELPAVLDEAINSVAVKYSDPIRREDIITPALRALALVAEFGEVHQTYDFKEIPTAGIATRVQGRELAASTTPTRGFKLVTTPKPLGWRRNTYFRLQSPRRGISDMVCIVASCNEGTLASGACQFQAAQDIYGLPDVVLTEVEHGIDTRPPSEPIANTAERVLEVPYIDAVSAMTPAEFSALPAGTGFVAGVAANPGGMRDFTLYADAGGGYARRTDGLYCPTAVLDDAIPGGQTTGIPITDAVRLSNVEIGSLCLLGDELCRVDAIDTAALLVSLGRGCADTLPKSHDAGTRIYFHGRDFGAADTTQYIDGESINVKLPSNTGSKQLALADAATHPITFANRLARPYPPADFRINGVSIYSVGTPSPGGGGSGGGGGTGGGGGGGVPPAPPPMAANGSPASTTPGPNGGYPDPGQPNFPLPDVLDTDIIGGGDFSAPENLLSWRQRDGSPLGPDWFLLDGALHFYNGAGVRSAYCYPARRRIPTFSFPRYAVTVSADVSCDPNAQLQVGVAWSTNTLDDQPTYVEAADPQTYPVTTSVTYTYTPTIVIPWADQGFFGSYIIRTFMPVVRVIVDGPPANASVDNVTMTISEVPTPMTADAPAHLAFDAGLTGWTLWPDPDDTNPYVANVSVSGGVATMDFISNYAKFRYLVCEDPLALADAPGKYVHVSGDVWCNDDYAVSTPLVIASGVTFGIAIKHPDGFYTMLPGGRNERGDFSPSIRDGWQRIPDGFGAGFSAHVCVLMQALPGKTCKVRNLAVEVTDAVID